MKKRPLLAALLVSSMILGTAGMAFAFSGFDGQGMASGKTVSASQSPYATEGHWGHGGHRGGHGGYGGCGY